MSSAPQSRADIIADLRAILAQHLRDWRRPWPGAEFGKTLIGNSLLGALERQGCDRGEEMERARRAAPQPPSMEAGQ